MDFSEYKIRYFFLDKRLNIPYEFYYFRELVRKDMKSIKQNDVVKIEEYQKDILFPQTVAGHAREGDGAFRIKNNGKKIKYEDVTIRDVCIAYGGMGFDRFVRNERTEQIQSVTNILYEIVDNGRLNLLDSNGKPPFGIDFFREYRIKDNESFLKGFVLGCLMDSYKWREITKKELPENYMGNDYNLGGGMVLVADIEKLYYTLNGNGLSYLAEEEQDMGFIEELFKEGVFIENSNGKNPDETIKVFVRMKKGNGTSDNLAILFAGYLYGIDAMYGVFLADAIDTYEKHSNDMVNGGYDEFLGEEVWKRYELSGKKLLEEWEIIRFIYNIAISNYPKINLSSSHRYLSMVHADKNWGGPSEFEVIKMYLTGKKWPNIRFGYDKYRASKFFKRFEKRVELMEKMYPRSLSG